MKATVLAENSDFPVFSQESLCSMAVFRSVSGNMTNKQELKYRKFYCHFKSLNHINIEILPTYYSPVVDQIATRKKLHNFSFYENLLIG